MKRYLLCAFALFAICSTTFGEDSFPIQQISLPTNVDADLAVGFSFDDSKQYTSYSFKIELPDGLEFVAGSEEGEAKYTLGNCYTSSPNITANLKDKKTVIVGCMGTTAFNSNTGVLLTLQIKLSANSTLEAGDNVSGSLSEAKIVTTTLEEISISGTTSFGITIANPIPITVLDEISTTDPESATNAKVLVKRKIKANTWSTICLPFAMSEDQVKSAFGDGVQLGNFISCSPVYSGSDITSIILGFEKVSVIKKNNPYIIKVSEAIDEFSVDRVDIDPETEPYVEIGGRRDKSYFNGTYKTIKVPEDNLFLSGGLLYYAKKDQITMKGFRGYFELFYELSDPGNAGSRAMISFDDGDGTTKIESAEFLRTTTGKVYSISGRYIGENVEMKSLPKGIYIVDGVKIVNK